MGESNETETRLRSSKEQAEAEERRLERHLSRWKTTPQTVRDWKAPINNKPLTLPTGVGSPLPPPPMRTGGPPPPTGDVSPPTPMQTGGGVTSTLAGPLTAQGKQQNYGKAEEFGALLDQTEKMCPVVAQHLAEIMAKKHVVMKGYPRKPFEQTLSFVFTDKVEAPAFDSSTARIALPIHKKGSDPKEPADPLDLVDGLIFETCNMEMVQTFDALSKDRIKSLTPPSGEVAPEAPVPLKTYGRDKSDGEAKSTLKDCELKLEMLKSGAPLARQGKRNIASVFGTLMASRGKPVDGLDAIIEDDEALNKLVTERKDEIAECFALLKAGGIPLDAVCGLMARTRHKKTAKDDETGSLPTEEMYQYEEIEEQPQRLAGLALTGDLKAAGIEPDKLKALGPMLQELIAKFEPVAHRDYPDANTKVARIKYLAQVQALLKEKTGVAKFPGLDFSPAMLELADKRIASENAKNPGYWGVNDGVSKFDTDVQAALREFAGKLEALFPKG